MPLPARGGSLFKLISLALAAIMNDIKDRTQCFMPSLKYEDIFPFITIEYELVHVGAIQGIDIMMVLSNKFLYGEAGMS